MSEKWQGPSHLKSERVDRATSLQYQFGANARIRREHMEQLATSDRGRDFNGYVLRRVITRLGPYASILDVGCGEGTDIFKLVDPSEMNHQGPVIGLEIPSPDPTVPFEDRFNILEHAMEQVGRGFQIFKHLEGQLIIPGFVDNGGVGILEGYAQEIPLGDESVDFVFAGNSIQQLPLEEQPIALSEIYRVLVPGGIFAAVTNAAGNKRKFHESMGEVGEFFGYMNHEPISSKFDLEQAIHMVYQHYADPGYELLEDKMRITKDKISLVRATANTYKSLFPKEITAEEWKAAVERFVIAPFLKEIDEAPEDDKAAYDDLRRGVVFGRKPYPGSA